MSQFGRYPGKPQIEGNPSPGTETKQDRLPVHSLTDIISSAARNFRQYPITIMEGLTFNQYELLRTTHFYLNSTFESGPLDENGDERYFHNIITPRNQHATKNIDLDTKDLLVNADAEEGWWFSFFLRNKFQEWMKEKQFGKLLNDLATNLPNFGKVIWKKCGEGEDMEIKEVDLRDCVFDPSAKTIYPKDNGIFLERTIMEPWKMMEMTEYGGWDKEAVVDCIREATSKRDKFIGADGVPSSATSEYSLTDTLPVSDVWECYGFFPKEVIAELEGEEVETPSEDDASDVEYVYLKVCLGNLESGSPQILYWTDDIDPEEDFPYKELNWFRRIPGRCLPQSNSEVLVSLQIRMNELVCRFFKALRMGSLHLFQVKTAGGASNLHADAQDGDIIVSKDPIQPIATEIRAFQQYQNEVQNIERQADMLCNTPEVVTGDNLPTNTPFRLGAQMSAASNKVFDQVREDIGLVLTEVFNDWIVPEIMDNLSDESVLEVLGSVEEMKMFDEQYRKYLAAQSVKDYVLKSNRLPTEEEFKTLEAALASELKGKSRKAKIEKKYFTPERIKSLRVFFDWTEERKNFTAQRDSMSTMLQIIASNPAILQNEESRTLMGRIMESLNISPLILSSFASKPTPAAPAMPAASPAAQGGAGDGTDANVNAAVDMAAAA